MGLASGIYKVDTHVYAQGRGQADKLDVLLYHMEKHGMDKCVIKATVNMSNQLNADIVKQHPDKFIALCNDEQTQIRSQAGEIPWTIEAAAKEIDEWMSTEIGRAHV